MITIRDNNGYVLVTALLMLLVLTVIGMAAISSSTLENLLSGNIRLKESNLAIADGCSELSLAIIERAVRHGNLSGFSDLFKNEADMDGFIQELRGGPFNTDTMASTSADIICNDGAGGVTSSVVDIDVMYPKWIGGTSIEFASGYEGLGKGGGSSGYATYYRINASGAGLMNSESNIGSIYRYVP